MGDLVCAEQESAAVDGDSIGLWWWRWSGELVSSGDTLANWILALFTGIGIFFLWRTLVQTNKTNDAAVRAANAAAEANRILRDEQRPWVTLEWEVQCEARDLGKGLTLAWNYNFRNKGKAPAHNIILDWAAVKRWHIQNLREEGERYAEICLEKRGDRSAQRILFPGEATEYLKNKIGGSVLYEYDHSSGEHDHIYLVIFVCLSYQKSQDPDDLAFEALVLGVECSTSPRSFQDKILEYAHARSIR